ncbi:glycosyl transferase family 2 [Sphingomonas sp. PP-F2F-A104-K0414]|uniref:glycosyltransferase family 2 protein n=1 Tax=Sphingomonas sp. PP-F2F-A104-K0414 TaxID=2135661 RepID=UPI0010467B39|nr:glycosyltransferase family A protein [Sphingomonas sp. PP-F2F-A104-K0414]TCQ01389.1 glycosyl transferase family 2 [Sphingomonas sp. PP-F2F-A104-K0414]
MQSDIRQDPTVDARASVPVISVVMAAYNGAGLIEETLASLTAQTFGDFEVIVVDDCSTDDTREVIRAWPDPRVRLVVMAKNGGPVKARNRGFAEARGRYIAALDHDDICRPDRFARQVAYLDSHPDTVLLGAAAELLTEGVVGPSSYAPTTTPALVAWLTCIENPLVWSSTMMRTEVARRLDPVTRPELLYAEDFDLYQRIQHFGAIARLDEALVLYRVHPGGVSKRFVDIMEAASVRVLTERYARLFDERAARVAGLIVQHSMAKRPVPDRAALATLGSALGVIQADFLATHACSAHDIRLIRWETARRWGDIGRAGLRAGTVRLGDVLAVRPDHLGLGYAGLEALLWSGFIGGVRRARRRMEQSRMAQTAG